MEPLIVLPPYITCIVSTACRYSMVIDNCLRMNISLLETVLLKYGKKNSPPNSLYFKDSVGLLAAAIHSESMT
jgi:hypothetical protein